MSKIRDWLWRDVEDREVESSRDIPIAFARIFSGHEGTIVLNYLKSITSERVLGANAIANQLYYLEGQRAIVALISNLIADGRSN